MIHWPVAFPPVPFGSSLEPDDPKRPGWAELDLETSLTDTWKAMIKLLDSGKVKAIGVSNFRPDLIQGIADATGVWPSVDQVEAHPLNLQDDLVDFCKEHNIHITAYSPLGNNSGCFPSHVTRGTDECGWTVAGAPMLTEWAEVKEIAQKYNATPAQVLIAWGAKRGFSVIPKSVTPGACPQASISSPTLPR